MMDGGRFAPPTPLDLANFVPYACRMLGAPFNVRIDVRTQEEYVSKIDTPKKAPKSKATSRQPSAPDTVKVEESATPTAFFYGEEGGEVTVTAVMDVVGRLLELEFQSEPEVPCELIKIIGLCVPFHQLLNKIAVRRCGLDGVALYEISKYLPVSRLTELILDDSPVPDRNYAVLLERPSQLKHLSLARCDLFDDDCIAICDKLIFPRPASTTLVLLNLSSNTIADGGARALGQMLRSNRTLQYLNLTGNLVTDAGAADIFRSLVRFILTDEEIHDKRLRTIETLKQRKEVYEQCLRSVMQEASRSKTMKKYTSRAAKKSPTEPRFSLEVAAAKAVTMADELLGAFADPFSMDETSGDHALHSIGNRSLCYLNLCYNDLRYMSITRLVKVLIHQSSGTSKFGTGLVRVLVEGNPLPLLCEDYEQINEILENIYKAKTLKQPTKDRGAAKSRAPVGKTK